jgi:hypothetical protein
LAGVCRIGDRKVAGQFAAQQNDPPLAAPARQPQAGFLALPALAGIRPVGLLHGAFQRPLDVRRHAQAEQVSQIALLRPRHHPLDAPRLVAAQQRRAPRRPQMVK